MCGQWADVARCHGIQNIKVSNLGCLDMVWCVILGLLSVYMIVAALSVERNAPRAGRIPDYSNVKIRASAIQTNHSEMAT